MDLYVTVTFPYILWQIAYVAAASVFDDRVRFPGFFRMLPSFSHFGEATAIFSQEMGWSQVAVITQDVTIWTAVCDFFVFPFLKASA